MVTVFLVFVFILMSFATLACYLLEMKEAAALMLLPTLGILYLSGAIIPSLLLVIPVLFFARKIILTCDSEN